MRFSAILPGLVLLSLSLFSTPALAFRVSPMVLEFRPSGVGATQTVTVENTGEQKVVLQVEVFTRETDAEGKEVRKETQDFSVFPQQLVVEPKDRRNIRLSWTAGREISRELAYRLVVSQLPVELKSELKKDNPAVNLNFLLQYVASLYVVPPGAKPQITVGGIEPSEGGKARVELRNEGNAHRVLTGIRFRIGDRETPAAATRELESENLLAGQSKRFLVPVPTGAKAPLAAEIFWDKPAAQ